MSLGVRAMTFAHVCVAAASYNCRKQSRMLLVVGVSATGGSAVGSRILGGLFRAFLVVKLAPSSLVNGGRGSSIGPDGHSVTPIEKCFLPIGEAALLESMDKVNTYAAAPTLNSMNSVQP